MNRKRTKNVLRKSLLLVSVVLAGCCSQKYADVMRKALISVLGDHGLYGTLPSNAYTWFQYPTNNFGIGTTFILNDSADLPSEANQQCATWSCIGVMNAPTDTDAMVHFNGFADVGGNGGTVTLNTDQQCSIAVNAVLPTVYQILSINGSFKHTSSDNCQVSLGRVYPRVLIRQKLVDYITSKPADDPVRIAFSQGKLAVAVSDYVTESMSVKIHVEKSTNAELDAALTKAVGQVIGKDSKISFQVSGNDKGDYTLDIKSPVIVATYIKKQPSAGVLEAGAPGYKGYQDWKPLASSLTGAYK